MAEYFIKNGNSIIDAPQLWELNISFFAKQNDVFGENFYVLGCWFDEVISHKFNQKLCLSLRVIFSCLVVVIFDVTCDEFWIWEMLSLSWNSKEGKKNLQGFEFPWFESRFVSWSFVNTINWIANFEFPRNIHKVSKASKKIG